MNKFKKASKYRGIECTKTHHVFRYLSEDVDAQLMDGTICFCGDTIYRHYYDCEKKQMVMKIEKRELEE